MARAVLPAFQKRISHQIMFYGFKNEGDVPGRFSKALDAAMRNLFIH
jgi:hypothetical protein